MRLLLILILFFSLTTARAKPEQKPVLPKKSIVLKTDSSKVEVRKIDSQAVKTYSKQKDFIYDDVPPETISWWQRFWNWIGNMLLKVFGSSIGGGLLKYILIALGIGIVVFIVIKLIGIDFKLLTGKSKQLEVPFEESLENIHEINFDEQIEKALQNGNYRLAVRLLYLKTLKRLSDHEVITWLPEKTNQAYIQEIKNENDRAEFSRLTYQFEYIWYGDFSIDKQSFEPIHQSFHQFNLKKS
ncbi:DUF4129 domain-containing protein [Pedobacter punctiformis]|uniref:DUF4129 domain-containing protein n=1 Tax=Pedobacter punctiformis TaxID=3004097 RepID=A0ABT4L6J1_9SPHI|nr:DUF4129 domain-containing protein [Pedobacter sp. HCMS5-2]MCZ4243446.1 DUF4129 domain-containing protein [Pedobacter sp. HCMS5-2]